MARPTKLTPELIEKAKTYLGTCYTKPITTDRGALSYTEVNLPTVVGLALYLGINKDTVYDWCKEEGFKELELVKDEAGVLRNVPDTTSQLRAEFSDIVKEIEQEQEKWLINYTAGGIYQPKLSSMMLAKHGYAEKTETDITSQGEKINGTILPEVLAEADRLLKEKKLNQ